MKPSLNSFWYSETVSPLEQQSWKQYLRLVTKNIYIWAFESFYLPRIIWYDRKEGNAISLKLPAILKERIIN